MVLTSRRLAAAATGVTILFLACVVCVAEAIERPRLQFQGDPDQPGFGTLLVRGLDARALEVLGRHPAGDAAALILVYTGERLPEDPSALPVLGTTTIEKEGLRFTPRFPLATGLRFYARFDRTRFHALTGATPDVSPLELVFSMPEPQSGPSAQVEAVYPSAEVVPGNLLRLYVHFSAPMREQPIAGKVKLFDDRGAEVPLTFVDIPGGLWDRDHRRLTLLFHPGRIKRGVGPHETMGPPLHPGNRYRLEVSADLIDAQGFPLTESFQRQYLVGAEDRTSPDPASWRLTPPDGPSSPLILDMNEPMDAALMLRLVRVQDERGALVAGEALLSPGETRWIFAPGEPWQPGNYTIVIDPALEDLAGNTAHRLFDDDTIGPEQAAPEPIALHFQRGAPATR